MKALPALPTVSTSEVIRTGEVSRVTAGRRGSALARLPLPAKPAPDLELKTKPAGDGGVIRVMNKALGISCPCATPEVAAQLKHFFSR